MAYKSVAYKSVAYKSVAYKSVANEVGRLDQSSKIGPI
jgi:hypothetical protein